MNFIEQGAAFKNNLIAKLCFDLIKNNGKVIIFFDDGGPEFQFASNRGKNIFEFLSIDSQGLATPD